MNQQYSEVPSDILTGKDIDYLSDMFEWNYGSLKKTNEAIGKVTDTEISEILQRANIVFNDNLNSVLNILNNIGGEHYE